MLNNTQSTNRWYDQDPTVSLAISILQNTSYDNQLNVAEILIENGKRLNISVKNTFTLFNRRWYDHDEKISEAIEYFRLFSAEEQKRMAIQLIEFLYNLDGACSQV